MIIREASFCLIINLFLVNCDKNHRIVIIGAGASGIAAASLLSQNDLNNFIILEAEGRIGGRIYSTDFGDSKIDLGAQWSHGEKNNSMHDLIRNLDLLKPSNFSNKFQYSSSHVYDKSLTNDIYHFCKNLFLREKPDHETSVGKFMEEKFEGSFQNKFGNSELLLKYGREILNSLMHEILVQRGAYSWFDLSMINNYERLKGTPYLDWKGKGHGIILDVMMKSYPNPLEALPIREKILFNKEVSKITWDKAMLVECADGSKYNATHIIFTASLGVLKDNHNTLFHPSLPSDKIEAINRLGIASVVKVALEFSRKWWNADDFGFAVLCWNTDDLSLLPREFPIGVIKNNKSWLENLCQIHVVDENPNVLIAWFTGEFVPDIELLPDEFIIEGIMHVLHKFFGSRYNITDPIQMLRNNWNSNSYFRGVYSFETLESRQLVENAAFTLSKPLNSVNGELSLLFAGEATSVTHYATVHGAIESGHREALRLINLFK